LAARAAGIHGAAVGTGLGRDPLGRAARPHHLAGCGHHPRQRPAPAAPRAPAATSLAIQLLAGLTARPPAPRAPQFLAVRQAGAVARAGRLRVYLVVLLQHVRFLPLEEVEAVFARLLHQFAELARRQRADLALRVHADPEQDFVLDDVADAGGQVLVEQGVGN